MNPESPERIKVSERTIELEDPNGDHIHEVREFFADDSWIAHGQVTSGPNEGKAWVKGHGGSIDGQFELTELGFSNNQDSVTTNDWGYMTQGGKQPGQPKAGDSWFKPVLHQAAEPASQLEAADLIVRDGVEQETDNQGRIVYEQHHANQKHYVIHRSFEPSGLVIETGRHVAGPDNGRMWETRYQVDSVGQRIPIRQDRLRLESSAGTLEGLALRQTMRDLELSDAEAAQMTPEQQQQSRQRMRAAVTLDLGGERWQPIETT